MILNAYAVLAAFVALVELALGVGVAVVAVRALRARHARGERADAVQEDGRFARVVLLTFVLMCASVVSWPLLYLLLDSYVPMWPGVMCIEGVTRIGTDSLGASGWLPTLVRVLQVTKPALVFGAGACWVLHLANRRTRTAPWTARLLGWVAALGILASLDASAELAYVGIPKQEVFLARGCCTGDPISAAISPSVAESARGARRPVVLVAFYVLTLGLALGALRSSQANTTRLVERPASALPLAIGAALSLPVGAMFLGDVAAPVLLRKEAHACAYCLLAASPVGMATLLLLVAGAFAIGWSSLLRALPSSEADGGPLASRAQSLLRAGFLGYASSIAVVSVRLALR